MKLLLNCRNSDCKETDGLRLNLEPVQSKLYSQNGCFLHYASSNHIGKYLKQNPPTQKYANVEEPVAKRSRSTLLTFNSKESCLFCGEMCSLRPDFRNPWWWRKIILRRTADLGKRKKVSRMSYCWYVLPYQWWWKFKLNFICSSKPRFWEINKTLMIYVKTMLNFVRKFQDGSHNSHCQGGQMELILFSTASLWGKPKLV